MSINRKNRKKERGGKMVRYTIRRLLLTIPIIIIVAVLIFCIMKITPGDPAKVILGDSATQEELDSYREYLGLNKPFMVQLGEYMERLFLHFDFGTSWLSRKSIADEFAVRLPRSFAISCYSILVAALFGIPLGVVAAVKQDSFVDKFILFLSSFMHVIPNYVYALLMILLFSLTLKWLPSYGATTWKHYIMPCACIFITGFTSMARMTRSSMLEVIRSDYVMAARAQGFSKRSVNYRHALPNAMIPVITNLGTQFSHALGGTMILETIFSIPGTGTYMQTAISNRDLPIVTGTVIILAIWFCLVMLLVDLLYAALDPRIKAQYTAKNKTWKRRERGTVHELG